MPFHNSTTANLAHALVLPRATDGPQTMSSQEIADLTGKQLSNVNRDIRSMVKAVHGDHSDLNDPSTPAIPGIVVERDIRGYASAIHLDRDYTMTVNTGYDVALRHKIMQRWAELERAAAMPVQPAIPSTYADALRLAATAIEEAAHHRAQAEVAKAIASETEKRKAEIGSRREATAMSTASAAVRKAKKLEVELDRSLAWATVRRMEAAYPGRKFPWKPLRDASLAMALEIKSVPDMRYAKINAYHALVWQAVYGLDVPGWAGAEGDA